MEKLKFEVGDNNEKYKVESICNSAVYTRELEAGYLLGLYYLVSWKSYSEDESTWEPISVVQQLWKLVSTFHKNHPNKPTATSPPINLASPNVNGKQKRG